LAEGVEVANSKPDNKNYSQLMRDIRPFVDFNFDLRRTLTPAQKGQITKYHSYIEQLTIRPHQVFRSPNKKHLKAAQEFGQHDPKNKRLKVAFVPNASDERMKLEFNKDGSVTGHTANVIIQNIRIDRVKLARAAVQDEDSDDPEASYVAEYLDRLIKKGPKAKVYAIQAGAFEISRTFTRDEVADAIQRYMGKYSSGEDNKNSNYWGNWLFGVNTYNFKDQAAVGEYRQRKHDMTKKAAHEQAAKRRATLGYFVNEETREVTRSKGAPGAGFKRTTEQRFYKLHHAQGYKARNMGG
jgi:hypothetical protein